MAGSIGLGTVVATIEGPTPFEFHFVVSEETARSFIESGIFIQVKHENDLILGVVQSLRRVNRYFSSSDIIHGSSHGIEIPSIYPSERWDYLVAYVRVLGCFRNNIQSRATKPVIPGCSVELAEDKILIKFLGLKESGLNIGKIRQSNLGAVIDLDRLLQKHLAILSISGGGKSYAASVIIEELLSRKSSQGRPGVIIFDVHGEYKKLVNIRKHPKFKNVEIKKFNADQFSMAISYLRSSDFGKFFPTMSPAQQRELNKILTKFRISYKPVSLENIINEVFQSEMNVLVKDALLGWLTILKNTRLFGNSEYPQLNDTIKPGRLIIFDFASITSLWKKRILIYYYLQRIFELRKQKEIPPVISFIEEAHQFAPEIEATPSKSIIHTIAREGRKFLCSLVLISQRPVNLSATALSQCNSHLILRILNPNDLAWLGKTSEGINQETLGMITSLGVGEGLLVGEAINYPIFIQIRKKLVKVEFDGNSISQESIKYDKIELLPKI